MLTRLLARTYPPARGRTSDVRVPRVLVAVLCVVGLVVAFGYHLLAWQMEAPLGSFGRAVYGLLVLATYGLLWYLLSKQVRQRTSTPARAFWSTLLAGLILFGIERLVVGIGGAPAQTTSTLPGYALDTGVPLTLVAVFKSNLLALTHALFAFVLLLRLRALVLIKRSKTAARNWHLMVGLMLVAALTTFLKPPTTPPSLWQSLAFIPAVALMVVNSFRLSWIVYLSFRDKVACLGLSLLLLALLVGFVPNDLGLLRDAYAFVPYYSYPLAQFTLLAVIFGILYCTTALLSLLFHLPTTGDFQQKVGEMAAMHSLTNLVGQVFDRERLVATIAASPVEIGTAHGAWLAVADPQSGSLRPRIVAAHTLSVAEITRNVDTTALYEEVHARREPLYLEQAPGDHRIDARPGDGFECLLALPLVARDEVLGVLFVTKEVPLGFERDDIDAMQMFAAQAALALDNARLFEEQLEKERLARELSIAREVQKKLLPQGLPVLHGLSICAASVSAQEVGGDYYDFLKLDDHRLAVIVADVSGKGTSAAFYMAELQGIFRALARFVFSPADFLARANEALATTLERNVFITGIYGMLDLEQETFTVARAGHCPAATIRLGGDGTLLRTRGLGLGLDRSSRFRDSLDEDRVALQPGDVFVLYTDGIVESRDGAGEEYGYERLLTSLRRHRHEDAAELHAALLTDLHDFLGHQAYDDDMTLVVLKWHGVQLPSREPAHAAESLAEPIADVSAAAASTNGTLESERATASY